ncbi:glycosyltransferase family A protein [Pasteurellaceae bacterium 22721_9_1]
MTTQPSVAIITSTIGRLELARAIESVKKQTYPCKHYIFVDGEQFADKAKAVIEQYDNLIVTYLPMNTGVNSWVNSSINAIAPYLVKEDIVCYLDDDNWYEPNHVQSIVESFAICPTADFVYSLRNLYDIAGNFICHDDIESLGIWESKTKEKFSFKLEIDGYQFWLAPQLKGTYHIDTNCYGFTRQSAITIAPIWFSGKYNDRNVFQKISQLKWTVVPTRKYSVNYTVDLERYMSFKEFKDAGLTDEQATRAQITIIQKINELHIERYGGRRPWTEPNAWPES